MSESARVRHEKAEKGVLFWVAVVGALALLLAAGAYLLVKGPGEDGNGGGAAFENVTGYAGPKVTMKLYFPAADGGSLRPEFRAVPERHDEREQIKELVTELIRGPLTQGLSPALPPEGRVKSVFLDGTGTAYLNLSREVQTEFPGGAWTETLAIYSLANTVAENFDSVSRVQILIEGEPADTLAGHIDISSPFEPRAALVKEE